MTRSSPFSGSPLTKSSNSALETTVPVGLFGMARNISLVLGFTAAATAARSNRCCLRGTALIFPPKACTDIRYMEKVFAPIIASVPGRMKTCAASCMISSDPLPSITEEVGRPNREASACRSSGADDSG